MTRKVIDWEAVEADYRAGILSLREMSEAHSVSHVMISKKAKALGWARDLKAKIQAQADALVNRSLVTTSVNGQDLVNERLIIEANAERIAQVRGEHRADIARLRALALRLLAECEAEAADPAVFAELGEILRRPDDNQQDRLNDAYMKAISLPQRIKGVKELAETLKVLVTMEREAYGIVAEPPKPPDDSKVDKEDLARSIIFMLSQRLTPS